jgi:hypothetical protein
LSAQQGIAGLGELADDSESGRKRKKKNLKMRAFRNLAAASK